VAPKNMLGDAFVTEQFARVCPSSQQAGGTLAGRHVTDARVRRTRHRLRDAIVSLIHEKSYPAIAVKEILERADVGRSAFYAHFSNKDALLASGIEQMLQATGSRAVSKTLEPFGKVLSFSFPVFDYIGGCRHAAEAKMGRKGRTILHQHLRRVLSNQIRDDVRQALQAGTGLTSSIPADLAVEYILTTFILVLNWWVEGRSPLSAAEVDDVFLALVVPVLTSALGRAEGR
jgi:AcrR family transcriptional regulator